MVEGWGGGGWRELTARTRKGTDLTHHTCLLSIILCECWSSMGKVHWPAQYSCDPFEPSSIPLLNHHPPLSPPPPLPSRQQVQVWDQNDRELRHQRLSFSQPQPATVPSVVDTTLSNFDRKRQKRKPANEDVSHCSPKLFELSNSGGVGDRYFF